MHPSISRDLISEEQEANLRKLAAYLLTLPADYPDFEMSDFTRTGRKTAAPVCGTAACAVGHGPNAGIAPGRREYWGDYSARVFISNYYSSHWEWCFGGQWSHVDNTVHGAAKRILWLLEKGLPANATKQRWGEAPICYVGSEAAA